MDTLYLLYTPGYTLSPTLAITPSQKLSLFTYLSFISVIYSHNNGVKYAPVNAQGIQTISSEDCGLAGQCWSLLGSLMHVSPAVGQRGALLTIAGLPHSSGVSWPKADLLRQLGCPPHVSCMHKPLIPHQAWPQVGLGIFSWPSQRSKRESESMLTFFFKAFVNIPLAKANYMAKPEWKWKESSYRTEGRNSLRPLASALMPSTWRSAPTPLHP